MKKRILAGALALMMSAMPLSGAFAEEKETTSLDYQTLQTLYEQGKNCVYSPLSLKLALAMAAEGAEGETLSELLAALGVKDSTELTAATPADIKSANAVFTADWLTLKDAYVETLAEKYAAEPFTIDDDILEKVNGWVAEKTEGMIDPLLTEKPGDDTGVILVNAISMEAEWVYKFTQDNTLDQTFHAAAGDVEIPMMHQYESDLDYALVNGTQAVRLPYMDSDLEMWVLLPEADGLGALLSDLAVNGLTAYAEAAENQMVDLALPKLDALTDMDLVATLRALGVNSAFSDAADFSAMSDTALMISQVLQKARVIVDEEGTKAAAATAGIMVAKAMPMPVETVKMTVDRPFAFVIRDGASGEICFMGAIEDPAAQ